MPNVVTGWIYDLLKNAVLTGGAVKVESSDKGKNAAAHESVTIDATAGGAQVRVDIM